MPDVEYTPTKVNGYMQVQMKVKAWCQHPYSHFIEKKKSVIKIYRCVHNQKSKDKFIIPGVFYLGLKWHLFINLCKSILA